MRTRASTPTATLAQLKALADPLRYQIFEHLIAEPRSAKQMAHRLKTHPTRLYHHFRVLEKVGLIRPAGTRQARGAVEKYFQAVVDRVEMRPPGTGGHERLVPALLAGVLGSTLSDLQTGIPQQSGRRPPRAYTYLRRYRIRVAPERAAEIRTRLAALADLCERAPVSDAGEEFGLTLAFYAMPTPTKRRRTTR